MSALNKPLFRLSAIAAATLFLELALIRWIPTVIFQVGFFTNFVLIGSFIGIGVGFLLADDKRNWFKDVPMALFGVAACCSLSRIEIGLQPTSEVLWGPPGASGPLDFALLALVFLLITWLFVGLGHGIATIFKQFDSLQSYSYDIVGSIVGILAFSLMSALTVPAFLWFGVFSVAYFLVSRNVFTGREKRTTVLCLVASTLITTNPGTWFHAETFSWSPYQMIALFQDDKEPEVYHVIANLVPHQTIEPLGTYEDFDSFRREPFKRAEGFRENRYERALIIGAGSGVDVEELLSRADHIDAVEIDPEIARLAKKYNRADPYSDPKVNVIIDDGRGVIQRAASGTYDVVVFARTDSLVRYSGSTLRLESFLFTIESFEQVRRILKPDGIFVLYNSYHSPSIQNRITAMLESVFESAPITEVNVGTEGFMMAGNKVPAGETIQKDQFASEFATDDWPFLYLRGRSIPAHYLFGMLFSLLITVGWFLFARRRSTRKASRTFAVPFFFMGVAFLLLETSSIVQFMVLFGTTWVVNSIVFAGVLTLVLLANLAVQKFKPGLRVAWIFYGLLFATIAAAWFIRPNSLLVIESPVIRAIAAVGLYLGPIFLANVIFSITLNLSGQGTSSFGWNLLGTVFGGCAEYASILLGYRDLLYIVAGAYFIVFLTTLGVLRGATSDENESQSSDPETAD